MFIYRLREGISMPRALKFVLIVVAVVVVSIVLLIIGIKFLFNAMMTVQMAPDDYTIQVKTAGTLEKQYLSKGSYETKYFETEYPENEDIQKIEIWYPADMENTNNKYPVVLFVNGTGVGASRYRPVFEHLASWGFIAVGNEDPSTWEGKKADETLSFILKANETESSIFYQKTDLNNIGVTGHSQGGVGVFNIINSTAYKDIYKCAVSLSPTEEEMAAAIHIPYNPSEVSLLIFMLCGTENDVISPENMIKSYQKVKTPKAMAVRIGANHGEMLYSADGYVTAWFMWQLQGDVNAAKAFFGKNPELLNNSLYQNQKIDLMSE